MKNTIIASTLLLMLSACNGKTSNIVSFSKKVSAEASGKSVITSSAHNLSRWDDENIGINIAFDTSAHKFKSHSLKLKSGISTDPVIADGKIFILTKNGYLTAFDEVSLKQLWSIDIVNKTSNSDYLSGGIAYHSGKLFVTNGSRVFDIIDAQNGNLVFSKQLPDILVTKPVIQGQIVILQTMGNQSYFLDLTRKTMLWDHAGSPETLQGGMTINPITDNNGRALISYTSGQVSLIDLTKRVEAWQIDLATDSTMPEYVAVNLAVSPIIEGENAYLADNDGKIFKIDMNNAKVLWKKEIDDVRTINNTKNALIMTTNGRQVIAIDKVHGGIIWATDLPDKDPSRSTWKPINYASSLIVNNMLHIYTSKGDHYIIDLSNGAITSKSNIGSKVQFVTITDKIRIFYDTKVMVSEPSSGVSSFKIFDRFKKSK